MKTRSIKKNEINPEWVLIDLAGVRLGQAATKISSYLIGKHKVNRVDYLPSGDKVIVINSDKVDFHPSKSLKKKYYRHSGYMGGLKENNLKEMMEKDSRQVIRKAVWGMLPKTKIGRKLLTNLKIYKSEEYVETAQKPKEIKLN